MLAIARGLPADARSLTFVSLVLMNLGLVLVNRSFSTSLAELIAKTNRALVWVSAVAIVLLALVVDLATRRELFPFGPLHADLGVDHRGRYNIRDPGISQTVLARSAHRLLPTMCKLQCVSACAGREAIRRAASPRPF
jgi:hypothetical protein